MRPAQGPLYSIVSQMIMRNFAADKFHVAEAPKPATNGLGQTSNDGRDGGSRCD